MPRSPAEEPAERDPDGDSGHAPHVSSVERRRSALLLGSVFVVAAAGLVYELAAGAVSSYLLGDAITQFSIVIGVFLSSMGVGAWLAKFVERELLRVFVEVEVAVGLIGGVSSIAFFTLHAYAEPVFTPLFYTGCALIGALVGVEIPLLVRILRETTGFRSAVSDVLALDYIGALAGALLFPLVALPFVGLVRASVVFGIMNLAVAAAGITLLSPPRRGVTLRLVAASLALLVAFGASGRLVSFLEDRLYQDEVVFLEQSRHQRIVLTRWRDDVRLFLDGHLQFSSIDEARYHESLVHPAMAAAPRPRRVLILGGGDGLAAREVLEHESVERVVLVDLDPAVTRLASTRDVLVELNEGALSSPLVEVVNEDAFEYLERDRSFHDVIIADLPDPSSPALARLYSRSFYALAARRLSEQGVFVTQATSPFFAPQAFWCIVRTIEEAENENAPGLGPLVAHPYHVDVPSFGDWGFVLAARREIDPTELTIDVPTDFLDDDVLPALFAFGKDVDRVPVELNTLDDPILHRYHDRGWASFH